MTNATHSPISMRTGSGVRSQAHPAPKVVCFGDSITRAGYPGRLAEILKVDVVNAGVGGDSSAAGLQRLQKDVLDHRPTVVVILFGTNDTRLDAPNVYVPLEQYERNVATMARECQAIGAKVLVCTIPPIDEAAYFTRHERCKFSAVGGLTAILEQYRASVRTLSKQHALTLVDLAQKLQKRPEWLSEDGVHPSSRGIDILAEEIAAVCPKDVFLERSGHASAETDPTPASSRQGACANRAQDASPCVRTSCSRAQRAAGALRLAWLLACVCPLVGRAESIIADHTVVGHATNIPPASLAAVKAMWVSVAGESHSLGYRLGCELLEAQDTRFQVNVTSSGAPEVATDQHLRLSRATWGDLSHATGWIYGYGEEDWYTSAAAVARTKASLQHCHSQGPRLDAFGFGWCWDMTWHNSPGGTVDPLHQVRWAGSSVGGSEGDLRWGLDADDAAHTGNSVCLDMYLAATEAYMDYCRTNGIATRVFFTTGPVDGGGNTGENGYQRHLKNERIRERVRSLPNAVLFDYADILCWGDDGTLRTTSWTDHGGTLRTYPCIHADNMLDLNGSYVEDGDHIGQRGAVRLAKALWWMLARMDGWDPDLKIVGTDLTADRMVLRWRSRTNETYSVLCSTDLRSAAWEPVADGIPGTPPQNVHTIGTSQAACFFGIGRP